MAHIDCQEKCEIPEGVTLTPVPHPRHAWGDVLNCPNDGCERSFLVKENSADGTEADRA